MTTEGKATPISTKHPRLIDDINAAVSALNKHEPTNKDDFLHGFASGLDHGLDRDNTQASLDEIARLNGLLVELRQEIARGSIADRINTELGEPPRKPVEMQGAKTFEDLANGAYPLDVTPEGDLYLYEETRKAAHGWSLAMEEMLPRLHAACMRADQWEVQAKAEQAARFRLVQEVDEIRTGVSVSIKAVVLELLDYRDTIHAAMNDSVAWSKMDEWRKGAGNVDSAKLRLARREVDRILNVLSARIHGVKVLPVEPTDAGDRKVSVRLQALLENIKVVGLVPEGYYCFCSAGYHAGGANPDNDKHHQLECRDMRIALRAFEDAGGIGGHSHG